MKRKDKDLSDEKAYKEIKNNISKRSGIATIVSTIVALWFSLISIIHDILTDKMNICPWLRFLIFYVPPILLSVWGIYLLFKNYCNAKNFEDGYNYYCESKKVSTALLAAIKRTNFSKTCSILQSTYGTVPNWHPTNYYKNVLTYDVHQHLRNICINLKELIVDLAPDEFNDDMITVDLAYTYPSDDKFKKITSYKSACKNKKKYSFSTLCGCKDNNVARTYKDSCPNPEVWKIITSGDHTSSKVNLHLFLNNSNSFYSHLAGQGYVFCNDKQQLEKENHYIWTSKDNEYDRIGSAIGTVIELKNDNPETVFVRAYLTITTYGRKLVKEGDPVDEERFEQLFRETVINSYKTLIESEFSQMFIRHGIKEHYIDPLTGKLEML